MAGSTQSKELRIEMLYRYKGAKTSRITMINFKLYVYFEWNLTVIPKPIPKPLKKTALRQFQAFQREISKKIKLSNKLPVSSRTYYLFFQKEEERSAQIEKENRILLEKMCCIMRTRGTVDNRNEYQPRSLNKPKRQRELLRLTHENHVRCLTCLILYSKIWIFLYYNIWN